MLWLIPNSDTAIIVVINGVAIDIVDVVEVVFAVVVVVAVVIIGGAAIVVVVVAPNLN